MDKQEIFIKLFNQSHIGKLYIATIVKVGSSNFIALHYQTSDYFLIGLEQICTIASAVGFSVVVDKDGEKLRVRVQ